jgi:hypothetical protein
MSQRLDYYTTSPDLWNRLNISFRTVPGSGDEMLGLTKAGLK